MVQLKKLEEIEQLKFQQDPVTGLNHFDNILRIRREKQREIKTLRNQYLDALQKLHDVNKFTGKDTDRPMVDEDKLQNAIYKQELDKTRCETELDA